MVERASNPPMTHLTTGQEDHKISIKGNKSRLMENTGLQRKTRPPEKASQSVGPRAKVPKFLSL